MTSVFHESGDGLPPEDPKQQLVEPELLAATVDQVDQAVPKLSLVPQPVELPAYTVTAEGKFIPSVAEQDRWNQILEDNQKQRIRIADEDPGERANWKRLAKNAGATAITLTGIGLGLKKFISRRRGEA